MDWLNKLEEVEARYHELSEQMADPSVVSNQSRYQQLAKQTADMTAVVDKFHSWKKLKGDAESARSMLNEPDPEMVELARQELDQAETQLTELDGILMMNSNNIRPSTDDGGADQTLTLRRPITDFQLDADVTATGVEAVDRALDPGHMSRYPTKIPDDDGPRRVRGRPCRQQTAALAATGVGNS